MKVACIEKLFGEGCRLIDRIPISRSEWEFQQEKEFTAHVFKGWVIIGKPEFKSEDDAEEVCWVFARLISW